MLAEKKKIMEESVIPAVSAQPFVMGCPWIGNFLWQN